MKRGGLDHLTYVIAAGAFGSVILASGGEAFGQTGLPETGGVTFDFAVGQTLSASDNPDLEDPAEGRLAAITSFSGSISSVTRSRALRLGFGTALELDEDGLVIDTGSVDLSYLMATRTSEFEVFGSYRVRDASSEELVDLDGVGDLDLSVTTGTRTQIRYGARLLVGAGTPLRFSLTAQQTEEIFDSTDPDAVDSRTTRLDGLVAAAVDEATEIRAIGSYSRTEDDDVADSAETDTRIGLGATRRLGDASTVSVEVDWQEVRTEGATDTVTSGIGGRIAYGRDLPNGSFGASITRDYTVDGTIDELRVNRELEFPASVLTLEAGAVLTDGDVLSPLLGVTYVRSAPDGEIAVSLVQDAGLDSDDVTVINTVGEASYRREINAVSSLTAAVSVTNQSAVEIDDTTRRIDASLSYRRALTDDVDLSLGYEHARLFETGTDERSSNTVFVTLSRSFSFRP